MERTRIAIIGCGDVAYRHYLPALADLADRVEIRAFVDARPEAADRAAGFVAGWSPNAATYVDVPAMVAAGDVDAAINLTPAPRHAEVSHACLDAGLHVYSEKPIAGTLADADRLIATARERRLLLLCAPGVAVTERFRWLATVVDSERLGRLTLAVAQHADTGPATWREYTGDPTPFHAAGVGPVFDHGVYRLHGLTMLLGPVRRVQAMGTISSPRRLARAGPLAGTTIPLTTPDHVLINLEFQGGALGQLLTSFAAPATLAPWMELQFERGTISLGGESSDPEAPVRLYIDDESALGLEGWVDNVQLPPDVGSVEAGACHFVACLRGDAKPVVTAEHARHVLDIILKSYDSIEDGRSHDTETTF